MQIQISPFTPELSEISDKGEQTQIQRHCQRLFTAQMYE